MAVSAATLVKGIMHLAEQHLQEFSAMVKWIVVVGSLVALAIYRDSQAVFPMSIVLITVLMLVLLLLKMTA